MLNPEENELAQELETYEKQRDQLIASAENEFVLIKGTEIVGTYSSRADAISEGYKRFGNTAFLTKRIVKIESPLNFVSNLLAV